MVRLCTHCKKVDTEYLEYKYCYDCYLKCLDWLEEQALEKPEPRSVVSSSESQRIRKDFKRRDQE